MPELKPALEKYLVDRGANPEDIHGFSSLVNRPILVDRNGNPLTQNFKPGNPEKFESALRDAFDDPTYRDEAIGAARALTERTGLAIHGDARRFNENHRTFLINPPHPYYGRHHRAHNRFEQDTAHEDRSPRQALKEWIAVSNAIRSLGGELAVMPLHPGSEMGVSDMVFTANAGYLFESNGNPLFLGARMLFPIRQGESQVFQLFFESLGVAFDMPGGVWEGQADVSRRLPGNRVILTHGVRTPLTTNNEVKRFFGGGTEFIPIHMRKPFFHGDTCINVVHNKEGKTFIIYCPEAMEPESVETIKSLGGKDIGLIPISYDDAYQAYVANSVEVNGTLLILPNASPFLKNALSKNGFGFWELNGLGELFIKGGGGTRCCVLELRNIDRFPDLKSLLMSRHLFRPEDWEEAVFTYPDRARLRSAEWKHDHRAPVVRVGGAIKAEGIWRTGFDDLQEIGPEPVDAASLGVIQGGLDAVLAPEDAYVTRGHETLLQVAGGRFAREITGARPGGFIRWDGVKAEVVSHEELSPGDVVLLQSAAPRLGQMVNKKDTEEGRAFSFMSTVITYENFTQAQALRLAHAMLQARRDKKKIVIVGGPAIAHSDGSKFLAALIRAGWVDVLSTGNALATHDLELNHVKYGTSLGASPELQMLTGEKGVPLGQEHHLRTINDARAHGSLDTFVRSGTIGENSVIRAALESGTKLIMAGSIRDDGPQPGVISSRPEANRVLAESLVDAGIVINVATYLHSAAALSLTKASVPKVVVDMNMNVLRRLHKMNPLNMLPIAMDAASFFKSVCEALGVEIAHLASPTPLGTESQRKIETMKRPAEALPASSPSFITTAQVTQDGVAPDDFTTSSNEQTRLALQDGTMLEVETPDQKMDGMFVVDFEKGKAAVKPWADLKKGDHVVVGRSGILSTGLSDKNTPKDIPAVAAKLDEMKAAGNGIVLVAGDALVGSGAAPIVADLIRRGYITALHCGSALPLYEVEQALYGTTDDVVNDVRALNRIRALGGLERDAFIKLAPNGIFAAAKAAGIPVVVTASPNDTGTIQGTIQDSIKAQKQIRNLYKGAGYIMEVATILHSIAAGNQAPGVIPLTVVDKDQFAITKLVDRGTVQAKGMRHDAGEFFRRLSLELESIELKKAREVSSPRGSEKESVPWGQIDPFDPDSGAIPETVAPKADATSGTKDPVGSLQSFTGTQSQSAALDLEIRTGRSPQEILKASYPRQYRLLKQAGIQLRGPALAQLQRAMARGAHEVNRVVQGLIGTKTGAVTGLSGSFGLSGTSQSITARMMTRVVR